MKIIFHTNVDHYKTNCWPTITEAVPRIGDTVMVTEVFFQYFESKKLPLQMKVVDVVWTDHGVVCELWYRDVDIEAAKLSGVKLL